MKQNLKSISRLETKKIKNSNSLMGGLFPPSQPDDNESNPLEDDTKKRPTNSRSGMVS